MKKTLLFCLLAAVMVCPQSVEARKKNKKYAKQEVTIEETAPRQQEPTAVVITNAAAQLYGEWQMESMKKKEVLTHERAYLYLDFDAHKVYGNTGCNTLNGRFQLKGNGLSFLDVITTDASCHNATSERSILKALAEVRSFRVTSLYGVERMQLLNAKGHEVMTLRRQNLDLLNGAWIVKELNSENVSSRNVRLVVDAVMQTLHGNTGCNLINGIITIDPAKDFAIQFEDLHSSGNRCDGIELETALLIALEQTESCKRINDDEVGLLDGKGRMVLVLRRLALR